MQLHIYSSISEPTVAHYQMVKRILRFLKGTIDVGHHIVANSPLELSGFSDSNWAGCKQARRSNTSFVLDWVSIQFRGMLISKLQLRGPAQKLSIVQWLLMQLRLHG